MLLPEISLKTSSKFISLKLDLEASSQAVETAMVLLRHINIVTLRDIHISFDGSIKPYSWRAIRSVKQYQNEFVFGRPSATEPAFNLLAFPNIEHIQISFLYIRVIRGLQYFKQRFSKAQTRGIKLTVVSNTKVKQYKS